MKKRNLVLQASLIAAFAAMTSSASATVTLSPTVASVPSIYASELLQDGEVVAKGVSSALELAFNPTWGVASGNHLYIRIDLTNGKFKTPVGVPEFASSTPATATIALSAGGGLDSTFVIYDVSDTAGVLLTNTFTLSPADLTWVSAASDVRAQVRFYTDASAASNATAATVGTTLADAYLTKGAGVVTTFTPATNTAVVTSAFKSFAANTVTGTITGAPQNGLTVQLGKALTAISGALDPLDSSAAVAADFATASDLVLTGQFGAAGSVNLNPNPDCTGANTPTTLDTGKTTATATAFAGVTLVPAKPYVCYTVTGTTAVPAQVISSALTFTGQVVGAVVPAVATPTFGTILHDGAETWALNITSSDNATDATFVRVSNVSSTDHGKVTGMLFNDAGTMIGSGTLVADLAANSTQVFSSAQIAAALGATTWTGRAKLHIVAEINATSLRVQNLIRTGGVLTNIDRKSVV